MTRGNAVPFRRGRRIRLVAAGLVLLALAGCAGRSGDSEETVTVIGSLSPEALTAFQAMVADSDIEVEYWGVGDVERALRPGVLEDIEPDVALVGDAGTFQRLLAADAIRPLPKSLDDRLANGLLPALRRAGVHDEVRYGVPYRASLLSLVWYAPEVFAREGYEIPQSFDELVALTQRMREDGWTPWCLGSESAQNSGWVLTDWIEELVLLRAGVEVYDRWAGGELPFESPEVRAAGELFAQLAFEEDNVRLGRLGIVGLAWSGAAASLIEDPPECLLNRQGAFLAEHFPPEAEPGEDYDVFAFPQVEPGGAHPVLGGVDMAFAVSQEEGAAALLAHLAHPDLGEQWIETVDDAQFVSPYADFDDRAYRDPVARRQATILREATVLRPEASRQLPFAVGELAFRTELIEWAIGRQDLPTTLRNIDGAARDDQRPPANVPTTTS